MGRQRTYIEIILTALLIVSLLAGCGQTNRSNGSTDDAGLAAEEGNDTDMNIDAQYPGAVKYYVSPGGSDDSGDGSLENPFASIEKARDFIRFAKKEINSDIVVYIREGIYRQTRPLTFGSFDSGMDSHNIIYSAYPGERPVISGGQSVTGWTQTENKNIWKVKLSVDYLRQFYVNGERKQRARTEGRLTGLEWYIEENGTIGGIIVPDYALGGSRNPKDMNINWCVDWRNYQIPVEDILEDANGRTIIKLRQPQITEVVNTSPAMVAPSFDTPFYMENAFELLDAPGEWYYDRTSQELYYWPDEGEDITAAEAIIPIEEKLLEIKGGSLAAKVRNLQFIGLTFEYATWTAPSRDGCYGIQTEWLQRPKVPKEITPASIQISSAENLRFERNTLQHMGAVGIGLMDGVNDSEFVGNVFTDLSDTSMTIGYPGQERPNAAQGQEINKNVKISNNLIYKVGREFWGAPGLQAFYVEGIEISHNDISDIPYSGICVGWGWATDADHGGNKILNNRISNFTKITRDSGGIYTLGPQTDSLISGNYIRNQHGDYAGIYCDEGTQYYTVQNNVIENSPRWTHLWIDTIGNLTFSNNYSTTANETMNPDLATCAIEPPKVYPDAKWPPDALVIIENAGLKPDYQDLLSARPKPAENNYPRVDAGEDQTALVGDTVRVQGKATDDGEPYGLLRYSWSVSEGPKGTMTTDNEGNKVCSTAAFSDATLKDTTIVFMAPGQYTLAFEADDGSLKAKDTVLITVTESPDDAALENIALHKPVTASSHYKEQPATAPENAVDGNTVSSWATDYDQGIDWLIVDLGEAYQIKRIEVVLRQNMDQPDTRRQFAVQVSNTPDFAAYQTVGIQGRSILPHRSTWVKRVRDTNAYRYVRFIRTRPGTFSCIGELRVFGEK